LLGMNMTGWPPHDQEDFGQFEGVPGAFIYQLLLYFATNHPCIYTFFKLFTWWFINCLLVRVN
jgi:hypothetical protein